MSWKTADLCDQNEGQLVVVAPMFNDYGGNIMFSGEIVTLKVFEDNTLVREVLSENGQDKVLVVDGGGSERCALLGGNLAVLAEQNNWSGIIIYGCVRDSEEMMAQNIGVKALTTHPKKSLKQGRGDRNITVHFADASFIPGHYVYADEDGIVIMAEAADS